MNTPVNYEVNPIAGLEPYLALSDAGDTVLPETTAEEEVEGSPLLCGFSTPVEYMVGIS